MNKDLLKEREEFRKRAMAVPVVENKKRKIEREEPVKKPSTSKPPSSEKVRFVTYKQLRMASNRKYCTLIHNGLSQ